MGSSQTIELSQGVNLNQLFIDQENPGDNPQIAAEANPSIHQDCLVPRADGGKEAWLFLAACFVVEALVWGR